MDKTFGAMELACPGAAVVNPEAVARRKEKRTQLDAPKATTPWLVYPEEIAVAGVDYPADTADPFYDERVNLPLDPRMVADIDANGVIEVINVVKDGEVPKVENGRRRTLHARAANRLRKERGDAPLRVKIILQNGDPKDIFLRARRSNAFRVDDSILQKARNAKRAMEKFGATEAEVAAAEGAHPKTVREWVALLALAPEAIQAIEAGQIAPSVALTLFEKVPRKEQGKVLSAELTKAGGERITTRDAEAGRKNYEAGAKATKPELPEPAGKGAESPAPEAEARPTRTVLRRLLKAYDGDEVHMEIMDSEAITEGFMVAVRWFLGDTSRKSTKGLTDALRDSGAL